ncbi:4574_t:CDS:2 [Ambispora leptoticha]|uniref:4574_t:CDS:1 n=1 Tax=Ambispora leptoticha TaxID=144679 RepID=A0A9N9B1E9_9GLOM|nr:4574_t:CDS:2 [Ambispora leptoticha]
MRMKRERIIIDLFWTFSAVATVIGGFGANYVNGQSLTSSSLGEWKYVGRTGASAMHMVVTSPNRIVILDKAEYNPEARYPDGRTGWTTEYNLDTNEFRMLNLETNTFCSAGAFLANGTLVETAGGQKNIRAKDGYSKIRLFSPCSDDSCDWLELEHNMDAARWYNTMISLPDGRVFNFGGSTKAAAANDVKINNPTYEFYPEAGQKPFQFLIDTLPFNLYPVAHVLPDRNNTIFIFASTKSILFDYSTGTVIKSLPDIPGFPRSYPLTGSSVMLPLTYENNYRPEILMCGGGTKARRTAKAVDSCGRLDLGIDLEGGVPEWDMEDFGGLPRVMPDAIILADGTVLFVNGAGRGYAGYDKRGIHQADLPVKNPVLYDPNKEKGSRWTVLAPSEIPRVYHSVATLVADGSVFVAGSNPNNDYNDTSDFPTEYRAERFYPPYLLTKKPRPTIISLAGTEILGAHPIPITYSQLLDVKISFKDIRFAATPEFTAAIIHFGFVTHSQHMSQRYVKLRVSNVRKDMTSLSSKYTITVETPPNSNIIAPGPSYLFVLSNGVPAERSAHVLLGVNNSS